MTCAECGLEAALSPGKTSKGRPRKYCKSCKPPRVKQGPRNITKTCPNCGKSFQSCPKRGPIATYCSRKCRDAGYQASIRVESKPCAHCGSHFPMTATGQRYCGRDCRKAAKDKRIRARVGDPYQMDCHFCGTEFTVDPMKRRNQHGPKYCSPNCARQAGRDQRRAKIANLTFERIDRHLVFERDEYVCGICHEPVDRHLKYPNPRSASLDHIIPIAEGGSHTYGNVQCSHLECNVRAHAKRGEQWVSEDPSPRLLISRSSRALTSTG